MHDDNQKTEQFSNNDLLSTIKNLKSNSAPGEDGITNKMVKNLPKEALDVILKVFNNTLSQGYKPNTWKSTK